MMEQDINGSLSSQGCQNHNGLSLVAHFLIRIAQTLRQSEQHFRFAVAQDLLDVLPGSVVESTEVVVGPVTGGALLAHTIAGLLDSRREITRPPTLFAPFTLDATCPISRQTDFKKCAVKITKA